MRGLFEAGGLLGQCRKSKSGLLLLAWKLDCGQWRFFFLTLCLLNKDQRHALTTTHLQEFPADLPKAFRHGDPPQRIVRVDGLDEAFKHAFNAAAALPSPGERESDNDSDSD